MKTHRNFNFNKFRLFTSSVMNTFRWIKNMPSLLAALSILVMFCCPAHAGEWVVEEVWNNKVHDGTVYFGNSTVATFDRGGPGITDGTTYGVRWTKESHRPLYDGTQVRQYASGTSPTFEGFYKGSGHAVLKWKRSKVYSESGQSIDDPNDNPPSVVYVRERGRLDGPLGASYFKSQAKFSLNKDGGYVNSGVLQMPGERIRRIRVTGDEVQVPTATFEVKTQFLPDYIDKANASPDPYGNTYFSFGYAVEPLSVSISASPLGPYEILKNETDDKELSGITRWKVRMTNDGLFSGSPGSAIRVEPGTPNSYNKYHVDPFISGQADVSVVAKSADGADLFPNQKYIWNIQKAPYLPVIPPPAPADQPSMVAFENTLNAVDRYWQQQFYINPLTFNPLNNPANYVPEWWSDAVNVIQLANNAYQIPDTAKPDTSTANKTLTWDFGAGNSNPPATNIKVQVTGADPGTAVINAGKVKINWKKPKKSLFEVTVFPVEWQIEPGHEDYENWIYTYFSNDEIATKIQLEAEVQAASFVGGEVVGTVAGPALKGARKFIAQIEGKSAKEVAEKVAAELATQAEAQAATGKAEHAIAGELRTSARRVEETGEAVVGEGADEATATRKLVPNNCFVAGTPVLMADNTYKVIEQVHVGDMVASREIGSGRRGAKRVLRSFVNTAQVLLSLTLSNGERITTTPGHPFATSERGDFVLAGDLPLQTPLMALGGKAALASSRSFGGPRAIYNFEVEDWHTYFVGKSKLWVHNASLPQLNLQNLPAAHDNALDEALHWLRSDPNGDVIAPPWLQDGGHWGGLGGNDSYQNLAAGKQVPGSNPTIFDLDADAFPVPGEPRGGGRLIVSTGPNGEKMYFFSPDHYENIFRVNLGDFSL